MDFIGKCIKCGSENILIKEDTNLAVMVEGFFFIKDVHCENCGENFKIKLDTWGSEPDKVVEA